jgi:hypothetical protein
MLKIKNAKIEPIKEISTIIEDVSTKDLSEKQF